MGINRPDFSYILAQERNEADHYSYKQDSIATHVFKTEVRAKYFVDWYFTYTLALALRIAFLNHIGVDVKEECKNYAIDFINDWVIYENNFNVKCATTHFEQKQLERILFQ